MAEDNAKAANCEEQSQMAAVVEWTDDGADKKYHQSLDGTNPGNVG